MKLWVSHLGDLFSLPFFDRSASIYALSCVVKLSRYSNRITMNNVWEPIDSACYAKDTSAPSEEKYDCTFVLVTPKKGNCIRTLLPRHPRELGERAVYGRQISTDKLTTIEESFSNEDDMKESEEEEHHSAKAPPSKRFHLNFRYNPLMNPFVDDEKRQTSQSASFPSISIMSLLTPDIDVPQTPRTPRECIERFDPSRMAPPCRPRHDELICFGKELPPSTLLPYL